jgi:hypothetical protein
VPRIQETCDQCREIHKQMGEITNELMNALVEASKRKSSIYEDNSGQDRSVCRYRKGDEVLRFKLSDQTRKISPHSHDLTNQTMLHLKHHYARHFPRHRRRTQEQTQPERHRPRQHSVSPRLSSRVKPCANGRTASRLRGLTRSAIPVFWLHAFDAVVVAAPDSEESPTGSTSPVIIEVADAPSIVPSTDPQQQPKELLRLNKSRRRGASRQREFQLGNNI